MSESSVSVEGLSKRYRIRQRGSYVALRDVIAGAVSATWRRRRQEASQRDSFWALDNVSLTAEPGETLGLLGANGAGKSTLLKILARITAPTAGRATIRGRLGSLLEVGTGFHQELTGRENIYLNGALLGMRRKEISRQFDEIVEFSGVGEFLDMPVKRYSSGMYVRLAFAVAAHLQTDVLLVDEVLAVGDVTFQRKCLDRMKTVSDQGRTIIFVSHNMAAIRSLCTRVAWLDAGTVKQIGPAGEVIDAYLKAAFASDLSGATTLEDNAAVRRGVLKSTAKAATFRRIETRGRDGIAPVLHEGEPLEVALEFTVHRAITDAELIAIVNTQHDVALLTAHYHQPGTLAPGTYAITAKFPDNPLRAGTYRVRLYLRASGEWQDIIPTACEFQMEGSVPEGAAGLLSHPGLWGAVVAASEWTAAVPIDHAELAVTRD
jgi:lipopolysaccharide transport system ATP-binding protein